MNHKARVSSGGEWTALAAVPDLVRSATMVLAHPAKQNLSWEDPGFTTSLETIKESLVLAYLNANMNFTNIPLKAFMDGFEKKILLACLRLTQGNQKNAAAMLNIRPTALFEKMRKHGIRSQRGRLPGKNLDSPDSKEEN